MEIYSLTARGRMLSHSIRGNPDNPKWGVIYFLARTNSATKEQLKEYVPAATSATIASLKYRGIIKDETEVMV